jgi:hypothetical protein
MSKIVISKTVVKNDGEVVAVMEVVVKNGDVKTTLTVMDGYEKEVVGGLAAMGSKTGKDPRISPAEHNSVYDDLNDLDVSDEDEDEVEDFPPKSVSCYHCRRKIGSDRPNPDCSSCSRKCGVSLEYTLGEAASADPDRCWHCWDLGHQTKCEDRRCFFNSANSRTLADSSYGKWTHYACDFCIAEHGHVGSGVDVVVNNDDDNPGRLSPGLNDLSASSVVPSVVPRVSLASHNKLARAARTDGLWDSGSDSDSDSDSEWDPKNGGCIAVLENGTRCGKLISLSSRGGEGCVNHEKGYGMY